MSSDNLATLKQKKPDNSFEKYYPVTTLSGVLININTNIKLSDVLTDDGKKYSGTAANASSVDWSGVNNKPKTLSGYGITDAISTSDVVTIPAANKVLKLDSTGKFPVSAIPQPVEFITYTTADIT